MKAEVLERLDLEVAGKEVPKFCPVMKRKCMKWLCMWFLSDRICAVSRIAIRLDAFIEGVPVVRLFGEGTRDE